MKILCTFPGKFGDILWSLPTVRAISRNVNEPVDFMVMQPYLSLTPLLEAQSYINKVIVNDAWLCTGSPHGDQPWEPQNNNMLLTEYDSVVNLGYRYHPGICYIGKQVIDFLAHQQNITLEEQVCPFIEVKSEYGGGIAYAFNPEYPDEKKRFWDIINNACGLPVVDVTQLPWHAAAEVINSAMCFIGDRSSNYVLAHGVAQKAIYVYEPNPSRNYRAFHNVFGNDHWLESNCYPDNSPEQSAQVVVEWIDKLKSERLTLCHD
jgi:hypothetical protein